MIAVSTCATTITLRYMLEPPGWKPSSQSMAGRRVDGSSKVSSSPPACAMPGTGRRRVSGCLLCSPSMVHWDSLTADGVAWGKSIAAGSVSCPRVPKITYIPCREIRINPTSQILRRTFGPKIRVLFHTTGRVSITPQKAGWLNPLK